MGQKANPLALRIQLNKNWSSQWFETRNISDMLLEDLAIRNAINNKLTRAASIDKIEIKRDAREINIIIHTAKPGMVIGRSGQGISDLGKYVETRLTKLRNYKKPWEYFSKNIDKLQQKSAKKLKIDIMEISEPESHAKLIAQTIATQLEKRIAYRRAIKQAISRVMQNRKIGGIKVVVAGRLGGVEIARRERFADGSLPLGSFKQNIDYAYEIAYTTFGTIGIKVWIYIKK